MGPKQGVTATIWDRLKSILKNTQEGEKNRPPLDEGSVFSPQKDQSDKQEIASMHSKDRSQLQSRGLLVFGERVGRKGKGAG